MVERSVNTVDAVLYTHAHADHIHGIDDLRAFSVAQGHPVPIYGHQSTLEHLKKSFGYIFGPGGDESGTSRPSLYLTPLENRRAVVIGGIEILPIEFEHGRDTRVFGYRFGELAYLTDVHTVPPELDDYLKGLDVLVINALWWRPHPTHLSIGEAVMVARRIAAKRTFLTHLTHETGHEDLLARLPDGIKPGYDGMTVEL